MGSGTHVLAQSADNRDNYEQVDNMLSANGLHIFFLPTMPVLQVTVMKDSSRLTQLKCHHKLLFSSSNLSSYDVNEECNYCIVIHNTMLKKMMNDRQLPSLQTIFEIFEKTGPEKHTNKQICPLLQLPALLSVDTDTPLSPSR